MDYFQHNAKKQGIPAKPVAPTRDPRNEFDANRTGFKFA